MITCTNNNVTESIKLAIAESIGNSGQCAELEVHASRLEDARAQLEQECERSTLDIFLGHDCDGKKWIVSLITYGGK